MITNSTESINLYFVIEQNTCTPKNKLKIQSSKDQNKIYCYFFDRVTKLQGI